MVIYDSLEKYIKRENNYDLFKLFYEIDYVIYKGGRFVDGW